MTLEEYLRQQGYDIARMEEASFNEYGGQTNQPGMEYGRMLRMDRNHPDWEGGEAYNYFQRAPTDLIQSYYDIQQPTPQPTPEPVVAQPTPQPTLEPVVAQPQPQTQPQGVVAAPGSLGEYLQQHGYGEFVPQEASFNENGGQTNNPTNDWGRTEVIDRNHPDYEGGAPISVFKRAPSDLIQSYYDNIYNQTRQTPVGQGINTFNEGNEDQKKIVDKINTGQLQIVPKEYNIDFTKPEGQLNASNYELRDTKTGEIISQQITAVDASKGIFNIVADDRNSSGYFNNYVSTDPKGFVNPIVSEQQSQYASRANNSLNFIKDSIKGLLTMGGLGATALGAGAALGSATGLGTVGGNIALNTGLGALKQAVDGQFNPLGLATSAALSYGLGGAGAEGADPLTADDMYTGQAMTNLASSDDATRLADLVRAFENPTELTGPTIDVASRPSVSLENSVIDTDVPLMPSNMQGDITYRSPLTDFSPNVDIQDLPQELDITGSLTNPYISPTFPTLDVSPEYDSSVYVPNIPTNLGEITPYIPTDLSGLDFQPSVVGSNLGGFDNIPTIGGTDLGGFDNIPSNLGTNLGGGIPTDLGGLDVPFDTTAPTDLTAGELTVTGERPYVPFEENFPLPYEPFEADFPLPYEPFEEDFPLQPDETAPLTTPKILSNILKSTPSALPKAIATQQQSNLANILRGSQMPQTALPPIYKQANPFNFGQQALPVQDTNALVKLLRTA